MDNQDPSKQPKLSGIPFEFIWVPIIFLAALVTLAVLWYQKTYPDNPGLNFEQVYEPVGVSGAQENITKLIADRRGHYIFSGYINGKKVHFLLDTGATNVAIPAHLGDYLGLIPGAESLVQTANGQALAYDALIKKIKVGSIAQYNIRGSLNPGMSGNDILLGMTFLKDLALIQRSGEVTLIQAK